MKKALSFLISLVLLASCVAFTASAAGTSMDNATLVGLGQSYSGSITPSSEKNYYKVELSVSGKMTVQFSGSVNTVDLKLFSSDGGEIWKEKNLSPSSNQAQINYSKNIELAKGTYYFYVGKPSSYSSQGSYNFKLTLIDSAESFDDAYGGNDNFMDYANSVSLNTQYNGQIALGDTDDYYKFVLPTSGTVNLQIIGDIGLVNFYIYSSSGSEVWAKRNLSPAQNSVNIKYSELIRLASGTYYLHVKKTPNCSYYGNYSFRLNFTDAKESFKDVYGGNDNYIEYANPVSLNTQYNGQIALGDSDDYYRFSVSGSGGIKLFVSGYISLVNFRIYDASGSEVWKEKHLSPDSNQLRMDFSESISLAPGTYYLQAEKAQDYSCYGNYSFVITTGALANIDLPAQPSTPSSLVNPERKAVTQNVPSVPTPDNPPAENNTTPPADQPTQAPDNDPVYDTPDGNSPEDVTDPPADLVEPGDDDYIIPDTDSDIDITINIYLDFEYTVINNYVVIVNYIGGDTYVTIPEYIENYTVVGIGKRAFKDKGVETVYVPSTVTQFGEEAFDDSVVLECIMGSAAETYAINNGFAHTLTSNEIDDSPSPIGPIILVAAVVVIVAVAGVVAVIIIGKKKSVA